MKKHGIKILPYRRKREGKTNYKKRLRLLQGTAPRLVVRKTNKHMVAQIVDYHPDGDKVLVTVSSELLKKHGWNFATGNLPSAYLTGMLLAKIAKSKNISRAIVDLGLQSITTQSRLYATVKGAIDGGLDIPCSSEVFPSDERLSGKHIEDYAKTATHFKNKPTNMTTVFAQVKANLLK